MSLEILREAEAELDAAYAKAKSAFANLFGAAESDATALAGQAETAAKPVLAAAETDAEGLATTAVGDLTQAVNPSATPTA